MNMHGQMPSTQQPAAAGGGIPVPQRIGAAAAMADQEFGVARKIVRERINQYIHRQPLAVEWLTRLPEIVLKVEERLLKTASSKEEYMNMETLEQRLHRVIKSVHQTQSRGPHISYSAPISTMIPTPGMSQNGNMNPSIISSADSSVVSSTGSASTRQSTLSSGGNVPASNGGAGYGQNDLFSGSDGMLPTSYQQPSANIPVMQGGNNIMSSIGLARNQSQMIPTPGLNNQQSASMISGGVNAGYAGLESTIVSQQLKQKQYTGPQNNQSSHNVGGQLGTNMRSNMQLKYDFSNGVINGGLGGNNVLLMDGSTQSESYLSASTFGNASNAMQQQTDQLLQSTSTSLPQQVVSTTGEGYGMGDISANRSLYASVVSTGSLMGQNTMSMPPRSKANTTLPMQHANIQSIRNTGYRPSVTDGSQKMDFQASHTASNLIQTQPQIHKFQQLQQFQQQQQQQPPSQHYPQFVQHPYFQRKQNEPYSRASMQSNALRQPLMTSDISSLMHELGTGTQNKPLTTHAPGQFHSSDSHSHYEQNAMVDGRIKDARLTGEVSNSQDFQPSLSHSSDKMQQVYLPNDSTAEIENDLISSGAQSETLLQGHWHPQPLQSQILNQSMHERYIQNEFQQRSIGQDEAQLSQYFVEDSVSPSVNGIKGALVPQPSKMPPNAIENPLRRQQYHYQIKWLLFLRHARWCSAPKGKCQEVNCITIQRLWAHMVRCNKDDCGYPRCKVSRTLIEHYRNCKTADCPVCGPVHEYIASKRKSSVRVPTGSEFAVNVPGKNINAADGDNNGLRNILTANEQSEDLQSSLKRLKVEHSSMVASKNGSSVVSVSPKIQTQALKDAQVPGSRPVEAYGPSKPENVDVKMESSLSCGMENTFGVMRNNIENSDGMLVDLKPEVPSAIDCFTKQETVKLEKHFEPPKAELKPDVGPTETAPGGKLGKPKIKGVSLTELFTPEQVKEHIFSLRQWVGQSKAKAEKNQAMEHNENSCQLCAVEKLTFEPPPIYCTTCGARIKRNATYYTAGNSETRHYFCIPCYNDVRGDSIEVEGSSIPKAKLEKKKNDEETEEWWVQCDKCEAWQHQICALFNGRRNDGGQAEYTCPNCYIQEIERGERKPLPQNAVLGAKDLPRTLLSDHIEQRLFRRLKEERQQRARLMGKSFDEVPVAEALVVRVVSSVDKKLDVKPRFLEIFQEENYPTEFPYKSKVVLLFQKIEGVEVCLFGMYVQEFGSECLFPNQRRVYLSYLDSVKYFRPEIKAVSGEALRTFVYHEILIGYLEYCKKRGFTSCYIWACPPLKGEDYILYCHPEIQKTPKSDKLREWYLAMLRKASKENIVVDVTNLYDHFFVNVGESRAKITAARLPYFDGDYWPGAAEDMINQLQQEEDDRKQQKRGKTKKTLTKRALKAAGHTDLSGNISKDTLLMQKLGETICPIKEDFIMVHLQHACSHCCLLMVSGIRWVCGQCKNFQLCEICYNLEQKREERERHPINAREKHFLNPVEINDVISDTKDKDEILESEFFDTRQAFLSLCQGNHYQYDTLRRAKHSSMMVLYHLHNPTAPAFVTTCNICQHDIETGQGWHCETCPDFDVCDNCYSNGVNHPHKLTNHPSTADAQNTEARQKRVLQLRKMLDLLVHASQCRFIQCQYPNCRKVKGLFRHGTICKTRASGGCVLCKKMWYLLQLHARACKESGCHVPRCRDLKEHLRRLQQQSDSRRRAAVMEMMRQRAAEVAGNAG